MSHFQQDYERLVDNLIAHNPSEQAMHLAVGGHFEAIGDIEAKILRHYGLADGAYLVDVGCGSGRLTQALVRSEWQGIYLGTDVVRKLIEYASRPLIGRAGEWRFQVTDGLTIEAKDADMICFFSVLTHLKPEESYVYLEQAHKALAGGGRVVLSYLDYEQNWPVFEAMIRQTAKRQAPEHLNTFLHREHLTLWASKIGFRLIELSSDFGLGQAVCVLEK